MGEKLAPKMYSHGGRASTEYADHVVLERLDCLLGKVATIVIGGGKFICHLGEFNLGLVCKQCLVVKYLVPWEDAVLSHLRQCTTAGKKEFALAVILESLAPGGIGDNMGEDHDDVVAKAGEKRETACLVHLHCVLHIDDPDEDVMFDNVCSWHRVVDRHCFVGGIRVVGCTGGINATSDWTP
jgi:hypothetical protein